MHVFDYGLGEFGWSEMAALTIMFVDAKYVYISMYTCIHLYINVLEINN